MLQGPMSSTQRGRLFYTPVEDPCLLPTEISVCVAKGCAQGSIVLHVENSLPAKRAGHSPTFDFLSTSTTIAMSTRVKGNFHLTGITQADSTLISMPPTCNRHSLHWWNLMIHFVRAANSDTTCQE
mmetsp:Transcript_142174/g.250813  ORF Transcript_142174/g.250813 Transcript_142174/m.250813 type:complete len:126 (-) Transcript_142174:362-739(-)